jgi:hypothetical protein
MLRAYQRRTLAADALIASTYLAGTNTRRVRRALKALFGGAVGKDTVSRVWRKVKADWDAWNAQHRSLGSDRGRRASTFRHITTKVAPLPRRLDYPETGLAYRARNTPAETNSAATCGAAFNDPSSYRVAEAPLG